MIKSTIILSIAIVIAAVILAISFSPKGPNLGGMRSSTWNLISSGFTMASSTVRRHAEVAINDSTSDFGPTEIVARNVDRRYLWIQNIGPCEVYLSFTNSSTTASTVEGIRLSPTSTDPTYYEIDSDNLYTGAVFGITSGAASSTVIYLEK